MVQRGDAGAHVALEGHEALPGELAQRLANREAGDAEPLGDGVLLDPLPGLQLTAEDRVAQLPSHDRRP
ncbi:MAG: hypothetical protein U0R24_00150 [Solirubrobacterales bacterium]